MNGNPYREVSDTVSGVHQCVPPGGHGESLTRNNIRAMGVPERAEGKNPVAFIEAWLPDTCGHDAFSPMFAVKMAHRVPARPPPQGAPPHPSLFRLLNYKDQDAILNKARTAGTLKVDNAKVSLFPDFSAEVQQQRSKCMDIKKRLRTLNIQYFMLYPAKPMATHTSLKILRL